MKTKTLQGFTLIELLVVITIIGILATIVIVNLNSARGRGQDTAVKEQMAQLRAAGALYYDTNYGYTVAGTAVSSAVVNTACITSSGTAGPSIPAGSLFADVDVLRSMMGIFRNAADIPQCSWGIGDTSSQSWVVTARMRIGGNYYCVDASGAGNMISSRTITASSGVVSCPTS